MSEAVSTQTSTDLERLRTWLDEHPYCDRTDPNVFVWAREERGNALRCFAIDLSVSLRYYLGDSLQDDVEKVRLIAKAHADYERNEAEAKALFKAWMDKPAEQ